jgi:hypothetical protein
MAHGASLSLPMLRASQGMSLETTTLHSTQLYSMIKASDAALASSDPAVAYVPSFEHVKFSF